MIDKSKTLESNIRGEMEKRQTEINCGMDLEQT